MSETRILLQRFELRRHLHGAGTASLFEAWDLQLGEPLSLKLWTPPQGTLRELELQAAAKQLAASALDHVYLAPPPQLFWSIGGPDLLCATAPSAEQSHLYAETTRSSWGALAELMAQVLRVTEYLHGRGLRLGPVDPRQIPVVGRGLRRGLRLPFVGLEELRGLRLRLGEDLGDPRRAPEERRGEESDRRADFYSMGLLFYELMTRRDPLAAMASLEGRRPAREVKLQVPEGLSDLVEEMLAADPEQRPPNANEVLRRLNSIVRKKIVLEPRRRRLRSLYKSPCCLASGLVDNIARALLDPETSLVVLFSGPDRIPESLGPELRRRESFANTDWIQARFEEGTREGLLSWVLGLRSRLAELGSRGQEALAADQADFDQAFADLNPSLETSLRALPIERIFAGPQRELLLALLERWTALLLSSRGSLIFELRAAALMDPLTIAWLARLAERRPALQGARALLIVDGDDLDGRPAATFLESSSAALSSFDAGPLSLELGQQILARRLARRPEDLQGLTEELARLYSASPETLELALFEDLETGALREPGEDMSRAALRRSDGRPTSLEELLSQRLKRLSEDELRASRSLALTGPCGSLELAALLDRSLVDCEALARGLVERGFWREEAATWRLSGELLSAAVLAELSAEARRELAAAHGERLLAAAATTSQSDRLSLLKTRERGVSMRILGMEQAELPREVDEAAALAFRAGDPQRALDLWDCLRRQLDALRGESIHSSSSPVRRAHAVERLISVHEGRSLALLELGRDREARQALREAIALAEPRKAPERSFELLEKLIRILALDPRADAEHTAALDVAASLAQSLDLKARHRVSILQAQLALRLGDVESAQARLAAFGQDAESNDPERELWLGAQVLRLEALERASRLDEARSLLESLQRNPKGLSRGARAELNLSRARLDRALGASLEAQREAEDIAQQAMAEGQLERAARATLVLAAAAAEAHRFADASVALKQLGDQNDPRLRLARSSAAIAHARLLLSLGQLGSAAEAIDSLLSEPARLSPAQEHQLRLDLIRCQLRRGELSAARRALDEAQERSASANDTDLTLLRAEMAACLGDWGRAEELLARVTARGIYENLAQEAATSLLRGEAALRVASFAESRAALQNTLDLDPQSPGLACAQVRAMLVLAELEALSGHPEIAFELCERGRDLAQRSGDRNLELQTLAQTLRLTLTFSPPERTQTRLEEALQRARDSGLDFETLELRALQIKLALSEPALDEARINTRIEALDQDLRSRGLRGQRAGLECLRAQLSLRRGDSRSAARAARQALEIARALRSRLEEFEATWVLAESELSAADWAGASAALEALLQNLGEHELPELQARALASLALASEKQGRPDLAASRAREAAALLRKIWLRLPGETAATYLQTALPKRIFEIGSRLIQSGERPATRSPEITESRAESGVLLRDRETGCFSDSAFQTQLGVEVKRARRHRRALTLLTIALEPAERSATPPLSTDRLRAAVKLMLHNLRDVDMLGRASESRFEILLPDTDLPGALLTAERLRAALIESDSEDEAPGASTTAKSPLRVAIGIASFPRDAAELTELVARCDEATEMARKPGADPIVSYGLGANEGPLAAGLREIDALLISREGRVIASMLNRIVDARMSFDALVEMTTGMVIDATRGERGFFMLLREDGELDLRFARNMDDLVLPAPQREISQSIARDVARRGEGLLISEALEDERFRAFQSVLDLRLRSVLCAPVKVDGEVFGVFYVDHNSIARHFSEDDLAFLVALAERVAAPLANAHRLDEAERRLREAQVQLKASRADQQTRFRYENIIGRSEPIMDLLRLLDRIVDTLHPIVIHGESGTGKELVAHAIHFNSARKAGPFVAENCAAVTESLLEAELFGYVRGAFTGAERDSKGLFELASGGTLFLDEIGDMSEPMQKKLLRVLEEGEVRPVGGKKTVKVDVRIISASNKDLRRLVAQGQFREDLYYRLNVIRVELPPLRDRREDIPLLVEHFLERSTGAADHGIIIDREALRLLTEHDWPGNIRELKHEIERVLAITDRKLIRAEDLKSELRERKPAAIASAAAGLSAYYGRPLKDVEDEIAKALILHALEITNWHRSQAAEYLGLPTSTLFNRMKKLGMG